MPGVVTAALRYASGGALERYPTPSPVQHPVRSAIRACGRCLELGLHKRGRCHALGDGAGGIHRVDGAVRQRRVDVSEAERLDPAGHLTGPECSCSNWVVAAPPWISR